MCIDGQASLPIIVRCNISVLVKNRHLDGIPGRLQDEDAAKFRDLTLDGK
jgi:hypothetical protein